MGDRRPGLSLLRSCQEVIETTWTVLTYIRSSRDGAIRQSCETCLRAGDCRRATGLQTDADLSSLCVTLTSYNMRLVTLSRLQPEGKDVKRSVTQSDIIYTVSQKTSRYVICCNFIGIMPALICIKFDK